ncbi:N(G),N(G)-dimethylarginine dimethylaminohydrolase 1 [Choanephora cucurbitarum]|uniref:N(G),N(G)-dimethylarginine dimethylaminohydrolase 1 n=1 Tax=Choanephora cucurbitarum TaxID=101091 RepID=A0A1C7N925_9FUNG|nr:N(G),N(G)-dimethylarginine dimethylaminohydrolase 1 [Choanephora cucurbitarum]
MDAYTLLSYGIVLLSIYILLKLRRLFKALRDIPSSFDQCVTMVDNTSDPIDIELARKQHEEYVKAIEPYVDRVVHVSADENHPDCCFVEDTAVVVQNRALINHLGAESRRKEVSGIHNALKEIPAIQEIVSMYNINPNATLDGGDVLFTGKHLFVGLSKRTNEEGARVLQEVFSDKCPVYIIKSLVENNSLHLKCILSMLNDSVLLITDNVSGDKVTREVKQYTQDHYEFIKIPDQVPSNILSLNNGQFAIYQDNFPKSEKVILTELGTKRGVELKSLCMSELIKADGALTCCSILIA